jgi:hypothetical protein
MPFFAIEVAAQRDASERDEAHTALVHAHCSVARRAASSGADKTWGLRAGAFTKYARGPIRYIFQIDMSVGSGVQD